MEPSALDDLLVYVTLGVVLGGRLGYVLFYNLSHYLENPSQILMVWNGGMAFHGGMLEHLSGFFCSPGGMASTRLPLVIS